MGREPVLEGGKKEKEWKKDALLFYAIRRSRTASDKAESWFTLADVKELFESSEQTKRTHLETLAEQKLLNFSEEDTPHKWQYRSD